MAARTTLAVVGGRLVRVLAVRQVGDLLEADRQAVGQPLGAREPGGDLGVVRGGRSKGRGGELPSRLRGRLSVLAQLVEHGLELVRPRHGGDVREVLRGGAQERRSADVDQLDRVVLGRVATMSGRREGVEVDAHDVERLDVVLVECAAIVLSVASREDARMDAWVERLHAPAEHLGGLRDRLDGRDVDSLLAEEGSRSPGRDDLESEGRKLARELCDARLVVDAQERATHSLVTTSGSSRCSVAWIRSTSVARGSTGTSSWTITCPVSMPSST